MASRVKKHGRPTRVVEVKKPVPPEIFEEDAIGNLPEAEPTHLNGAKKEAPPKVEEPKVKEPKVEEPKPEPPKIEELKVVVVPRDDNIAEEEEEEVAEEEVAEEEEVEEPLADETPEPIIDLDAPAPNKIASVPLEDDEDDDKPLIPKQPAAPEPTFYDKYTRNALGFDLKIKCADNKTLYFSSYCMRQHQYFKEYFNRDEFDGINVDLSKHSVEAVGAVIRYMDPFVATKQPGLIDLQDIKDVTCVSRDIVKLVGSWAGFKDALGTCYAAIADTVTGADLDTLKAYDSRVYQRAASRLLEAGKLSTVPRDQLIGLLDVLAEFDAEYNERYLMLVRVLNVLRPVDKLSRAEIEKIMAFNLGSVETLALMYVLSWSSDFVRRSIEYLGTRPTSFDTSLCLERLKKLNEA